MEVVQTANPLSIETVWAALQEIAKRQEEIDIQIKNINMKIEGITHQKNTNQMTEKDTEQFDEDELEEIEKEKKRLWDKWVGETLYFGEIPDYMLLKFLMKKFFKIGLNFYEGRPNFYVSDDVNQLSISADFMMRNDEKEMLVMMKKELTNEDVQEHIRCLEEMRVYADLHGDSGLKLKSERTFLGAVAGVVVSAKVKKYALGKGLYVIEPSGVSFTITPPNGKPKEW